MVKAIFIYVSEPVSFCYQEVPYIAWGKRSRVLLDVGCGVASFGGYLFERNVLAMSLAPKDEHEAQVQFALERGIPAISAVMGTQRLVFPSNVFDVVHCARCRVPWHIEGNFLSLAGLIINFESTVLSCEGECAESSFGFFPWTLGLCCRWETSS